MTAVSSAAEAILYIGQSTADPLPAPGSDTFVKVPQLKTVDVPQPSKGTQKENTLDGVTISSTGTAQWSNCTGSFLTGYLSSQNTTHGAMIGDAGISGRKRNFRTVEPDAGGRQTDFVGEVVSCKGGQYAAAIDGAPARPHEFEIAVSGTPVVTP